MTGSAVQPLIAFDAAVHGTQVPPEVQHIIDRFAAVRDMGAAPDGNAFDFVHGVEAGSKGTDHVLTGFYKPPVMTPPQVLFPVIKFYLKADGSRSGHFSRGERVDYDQAKVESIPGQYGRYLHELKEASPTEEFDHYFKTFVVECMPGHPARRSLMAHDAEGFRRLITDVPKASSRDLAK
jgi:hypothetical protein